MARKPKLKPSDVPGDGKLLDALKFIDVAQTPAGTLYETHIVLNNYWASAFNGCLAAGMPIQENLAACPQSAAFLSALARCGDEYTLTQLDAGKLCVQTQKFKAFIPCSDLADMQRAYPDAAVIGITDEFRKALKICQTDGFAGDERIFNQSILVKSGSCVGTNGALAIEYWHGLNLPTIVVPKAFAEAVCKIKKPLKGFGCSNVSATVHYEDNSWLRTQLFVEPWPDMSRVLDVKSNPWPVPTGLFDGLRSMLPFLENSQVWFKDGLLRSHVSELVGAQYKIEGLPSGPIFNAKQLLEIEPLITSIDFMGDSRAHFFGENMRGVLMGLRL